MSETISFLYYAWRAFRNAKQTGRPTYFGVTRHGIPTCCIFVATGREAWRISQRAIEEFQPEQGTRK